MDGPRYTIGVDFGTESARAVLVDVADGRELAVAVHPYANGVMDERLPAPDGDVRLDLDWALQDPNDYLEALRQAVPGSSSTPPSTPRSSSASASTSPPARCCRPRPTGRRSASLDAYRREPHAWVKLWKHHAAQPEADEINRVAAELAVPWLARYGGKISAEWFFPKALQILRRGAPGLRRGGPTHRGG